MIVGMKAAVLYEPGQRLRVEAVQLSPPRAGEVQVRIGAAGVCHSGYHVMRGDMAGKLLTALGHEGAGIVETVGQGRQQRCTSRLCFDRVVERVESRASRGQDEHQRANSGYLADPRLKRHLRDRPRERTRVVGKRDWWCSARRGSVATSQLARDHGIPWSWIYRCSNATWPANEVLA